MGRCSFCRVECVAGAGRSFHRFPRDPGLKREWIKKLKENDSSLSDDYNPKGAVLCSDHFKRSCFTYYYSRATLKPGSVPTIFETDFEEYPAYVPPTTSETVIFKSDQRSIATQDQNRHLYSTNEDFTASTSTKISRRVALIDHNYMIPMSEEFEDLLTKSELMMKNKKPLGKLFKRRVHSLNAILSDLDNHCLLSDSGLHCLDIFTDGQAELQSFICLIESNKRGTIKKELYPQKLCGFALTLFFISPTAYDYVRDTYNLALPNPDVLRNWYMSINYTPGFTEEALIVLKSENEYLDKKLLCSLIIDEICVERNTLRGADGNPSTSLSDAFDIKPVPQQALIFMVVSHSYSWKLPVAYYFIPDLQSGSKIKLIKHCIIRLHSCGVKITSISLKESIENLAIIEELGANFDVNGDFKHYFPHPLPSEPKISIFLDPSQMLNNIRRCFEESSVLFDENNEAIKWEYIETLNRLQALDGVMVGDKLINFQEIKINTQLDTHVFSARLADVIQFCEKVLHLQGFTDTNATVRFLRAIESIHSFLIRKQSSGKGNKGPLTRGNEALWRDTIVQNINYLKNIKHSDGTFVMDNNSPWKSGFRGFYSDVTSVIHIFDYYIKKQREMKSLLTYKLNQEKLTASFSNSNPNGTSSIITASQFITTYKHLITYQIDRTDLFNRYIS